MLLTLQLEVLPETAVVAQLQQEVDGLGTLHRIDSNACFSGAQEGTYMTRRVNLLREGLHSRCASLLPRALKSGDDGEHAAS